MSSFHKFFWFMQERELIRLRRKEGRRPPWTEDSVLRERHFCNVFRHHDRVSRYWAEVCNRKASDQMLVVNTMLFRLFNLPTTWHFLSPSWHAWRPKTLVRKFGFKSCPKPLFNSAYMVTGSTGAGRAKHLSVIDACTEVHAHGKCVLSAVNQGTLQRVTEVLARYPMMGPFMGYEVACDLAMVGRLEAQDRNTWANLGPGARRGLNRIHHRPLRYPLKQEEGVEEMQELLHRARAPKGLGDLTSLRRNLDMRAIEHTLCEFDKWERAQGTEQVRLRRFTPTPR